MTSPSDDQLLASACPIIGKLGSAFYFTPPTLARGAELGLDFPQFYVLGRGGVLGDVEPVTVWSAFGYFNPTMVEATWNAARAIVAPRDAGRAHYTCSAEHGRAQYGAVDGLDAFVESAEAVATAADPFGLSLFAAYSAEQRVADAPGRAQQLLTLLREYRGSAHLIALRSVGVDSKTAHFVKRPNDIAMFGWTAADAPEITDATHAALAEAERLTDAIVAPAFSVLDDAGRDAFLTGLHAVAATYG